MRTRNANTWSGTNDGDDDDDSQQLYPLSNVNVQSYQHTSQERTSAVRKVLNTSDLSGFTPAGHGMCLRGKHVWFNRFSRSRCTVMG